MDSIISFFLGLGLGSIATIAFGLYIVTRTKVIPESEALREANRENRF